MNPSKSRRSKKAVTAGAVLLAVMLTASACSGNNNTSNTGNGQQGNVNDSPVVDLPDESGVIDPEVSAPEPTANPNHSGDEEEPANEPVKTGEGTYTGLADSHSVEIVTPAGAMVFQITAELAATVDRISADSKVQFEYIEKAIEGDADVTQKWLVKIEEIK